MSLNVSQAFRSLTKLKKHLVITSFLSFPVLAIQPMTESDLEVVSATTGSNILNIFGASQAGLRIDGADSKSTDATQLQLESESFDEGEATKSITLKALLSIEEDRFKEPQNNDLTISKDAQTTILKLNEQTKGTASIFSTSSEINYKTSNVHHEMREIENGGIAVSRDLQIDLLKVENLKGVNSDNSRSAGSIYLSVWRSLGDTRILTTK